MRVGIRVALNRTKQKVTDMDLHISVLNSSGPWCCEVHRPRSGTLTRPCLRSCQTWAGSFFVWHPCRRTHACRSRRFPPRPHRLVRLWCRPTRSPGSRGAPTPDVFGSIPPVWAGRWAGCDLRPGTSWTGPSGRCPCPWLRVVSRTRVRRARARRIWKYVVFKKQMYQKRVE